MRRLSLLALVIALLLAAPAGAQAAAFGPLAPANPALGPTGTSSMHGDSEQSDTTPLPGPGSGEVNPVFRELGAACPTTLIGHDKMPVATCTAIADRSPNVFLLDPDSGLPVARLQLPKGSLFAGVYPYMDHRDRLVIVDGNGDLLRVAHDRGGPAGSWQLRVDERTPLGPALTASCGNLCGGVVGLSPDWRGRVWFAASDGVAGYADTATGQVRTVKLGNGGEQVANSIATAPGGTAIVTDHALYLLAARPGAEPRVVWRRGYDRGPARKPGQLSHGSGATPTFFGPRSGTEYLAITDNAAPHEQLLVYDTRTRSRRTRQKSPRLVCRTPVLTHGDSGTENSPVGSGRDVWVASTYGYPYPAQPEGAEPTQPASAPFAGGLTRVRLRGGSRGGCDTRWDIPTRSAAVPRLSVPDGLIYTTERVNAADPSGTGPLDSYRLVTIDAGSGHVLSERPVGASSATDTLQMAPTIGPGGVIWQGAISGLFRIAPR